MTIDKKKAFSLIEIFIVLAILLILALIIIIAYNPGEKMALARDTVREKDIVAIQTATYIYNIDNFNYPAELPYFYATEEDNMKEICNTNNGNKDCPNMVDLSLLTEEGYLPSIPVDPHGGNSVNGTGYWIARRSIIVSATKVETKKILVAGITEGEFLANEKEMREAPTTVPLISNIAQTSVTVTAQQGNQVRVNNSSWKNSPHTFTGLTPATQYSARERYGITEVHNSSLPSEETTFLTLPESVEIGGDNYAIVVVGSQTWMAENLNLNTGNSWCYGGNNANCNVYGRLYDYNTARNVCPEGWRLPTDNDWKELEEYLGMSSADLDGSSWRNSGGVGSKLKSTVWGGTDDYGFNALPGGSRNYVSASGDRTDGSSGTHQPDSHPEYIEYHNMGSAGNWWVDYQYGRRGVAMDQDGVNRSGCSANEAFSVRCVQE